MVRALVNSRMLDSLGNFFPATCTIQQVTETQDDYGQIVSSWTDRIGHTEIPCAVSPAGIAQEVKRSDGTITVVTHKVALQGSFPAIVPADRAIVSGITYDILGVNKDSHNITTTLLCEVVT